MLSGVFGVGLVGVACYLALSASNAPLQWLGAVLVFGVGANLVYSAASGTESWMSKLGPLP